MRFGVCCSLDQAQLALDAGADYVELGASGFNGLDPEWDSAPYQGLPIETTNLFFPSEIKLFGEEASERTQVMDYAKLTLERASSLGVQLMVIGSGGSRRAPAPGMAVSLANREFVKLVSAIQSEAMRYAVTIAPESLNRSETNVGNDLGWMANALHISGAGFTADSFHILYEWDANMREGDPFLDAPSEFHMIEQIPIRPSHVHFGDLPRFYPKMGDPMIQAFCSRLIELEYDGRVSLECRWDDFDADLPKALAQAKRLFGG